MSSKEKNSRRVMIITIITSIIVILGTVSYAFYQTAINGAVSGTIAKWSFTANNQTDTFELNLGELYPGKSGTYNITLSATNSDLDIYYELIFTDGGYPTVKKFMFWELLEGNYDKHMNSYVGRYGVITKGSSITIPIYLNWSYNNSTNIDKIDEYTTDIAMPEIKIIAQQYTGYSGSIPMNLLGFTNLISYNNLKKEDIIQVADASNNYGYSSYSSFEFEAIDSTSGYIVYYLGK